MSTEVIPVANAESELIARLDAALPQTQCTRCGYPDCMSYARAIAQGQADINQCPPGGAEGVLRLAAITSKPARPLDPAHGLESVRTLAIIDEDWCIGCTLCIKACPTDAIVGGNKRMHTVIEPYCTGCELCLPVCPVDCISLVSASAERTGWSAWSPEQADQARSRYQWHQQRQQRDLAEHEARQALKAQDKLEHLAEHSKLTDPVALDRKRSMIEAALARAKARQAGN